MFLDYLSSRQRQVASLAVIVAGLAVSASESWAADATPLDTDINVDGLSFTGSDPFVFGGAYSQDATAVFNGNDLLVQTQNGFGGGAGLSIPVSNGENGINQSLDGPTNEDVNADVPNATPANSVFATIGNASGKLENGNVVRYSMWVRSDPANPITKAPQIEPVLKFEFWKEAFGGSVDNGNGTFQPQPFYGDKIVDTDQHQTKGIWIDIDNSGTVADATAAADGRVRTINTTSWTLIEVQHVLNDADWLGIGDDPYTVADVEEIRGVMFWGDFANTDLTNGGSIWLDNAKMEVFKNLASVTPNTSPNPTLSEGGLPGDFDNDQDVDGTDLGLWRSAFGATAVGDADDDGDSDGNDFLIWQRNLGPAGIAAVPEPTSASLLDLALASLAGLRGRLK
ncbi:MAG: hypothetical protein H0T51_04070 [Pirellulales bacterium]|nr:hypothetical protein [Pirellulales bacterium]